MRLGGGSSAAGGVGVVASAVSASGVVGYAIFAPAEGSFRPEFFRVICLITVTGGPLVRRVTISLLSLAWPRTLTWFAATTAGPATSGTLFNSLPVDFCLAEGFSVF